MEKFKVKCVNQNDSIFFKTGKFYVVIDGYIIDESGERYNEEPYFSVEEINENCFPQFELEEFTKPDINPMLL